MKKQKKETTGAKDIFFSHDANSASDPKMLKLLFRYGFKGYGWYWRILEAMRREEEYDFSLCLKDESSLEAIASMLSTANEDKIELKYLQRYLQDCCNSFNLFVIKNERIMSESLCRRMNRMIQEREKKSLGGKISAERRLAAVDVQKTPATDFQDSSKIASTELNKHKHKHKHKVLSNTKVLDSKQAHEFEKSIYFDKQIFFDALASSDEPYCAADFIYYYEVALNGSKSKGYKYKDWIAAVKNWIRKDLKNNPNKFKSQNNGRTITDKYKDIEERIKSGN
jgi:hypothetical protein